LFTASFFIASGLEYLQTQYIRDVPEQRPIDASLRHRIGFSCF
jgi:hypothetical protein